ncbi:MAG: dockerin type I domain-containing protein [Pirellulaceae bacterium]
MSKRTNKSKSSSERRINRRVLSIESMESRTLLAADLFIHNLAMPEDVNGDQYVSPVDALAVIQHLNASASGVGAGEGVVGLNSMYLDVNGDSLLSPIDALHVINTLNGSALENAPSPATPAPSPSTSADVQQEGEYEGQFGDQNGPDAQNETASAEDDAPVKPVTPAAPVAAKGAPSTNVTPATPATSPSTSADAEREGNDSHEAEEIQFVASVTGTGTETATVTFESGNENGIPKDELNISVRNLVPNSTLDVIIGGVTIGQITTDTNGRGHVELTSAPHDPDELPLTADFPGIEAGGTVEIGALSGSFTRRTSQFSHFG